MFHMKQCDLIGVQSGRHTISRLLHAFLCAFQASDVFITTLSRAHWQKGQLFTVAVRAAAKRGHCVSFPNVYYVLEIKIFPSLLHFTTTADSDQTSYLSILLTS